jgi:hypothetical protein
MSKGMKSLATDEMPIEDEEISTHQEAVPVPAFGGTRKLAVRWLGEAVDMITVQAEDSEFSKK